MTRAAAIARAEAHFDSGEFKEILARRVAIPVGRIRGAFRLGEIRSHQLRAGARQRFPPVACSRQHSGERRYWPHSRPPGQDSVAWG